MTGWVQKAAAFVVAALMAPQSNLWTLSMDDATMMAKCLWGECRGVESPMERAAVCWCILNRVDDDRWPGTIQEVIGQPCQFTGYKASNPVDQELLVLSMDVITRWMKEKDGDQDVGRVLPREYCFFVNAGGGHNKFSTTWPVSDRWDWSLEDPYAAPEEEPIIPVEEMDEHDELSEYMRSRQNELDPADGGSALDVQRRQPYRSGRSRRW